MEYSDLRMVELRHFRYFLAVAETLHFGRAAQRLAISQPPLSVAIAQLEQQLQVRLFERNSKGVRLTAAGQSLRLTAQRLLAQVDDAAVQARDAAAGIAGQVRVGFVGSMLYRGLPQALADYQQAHPAVRVTLAEANTQTQVGQLLCDELDLGFVHTSRLPDALQSELALAEPFVCCLPQGHARAAARQLSLSELRSEAFVLFARSVSPDYHEAILGICAQAGFTPSVRHEVRHWLAVVSWVAQGLGVALVPRAMSRCGLPGAVFVPLREQTALSESYLVWRREGFNPAAHHCIRHLAAYFAGKPPSAGKPAGRRVGGARAAG